MKLLIKWMTFMFVGLICLRSAMPVLAQEEKPLEGQRGAVRGQVTAVNDTGLTIATRNGQSIEVVVTAKTKILLMGSGAEGSLSDIQVGDWVGVRGPKNDDGTIQARLIGVLGEDFKKMARALGEVTAVNGSTFTLQSLRRGELTIITDDSTRFRSRGQQVVSLSDIKVGTKVVIFGERVEGEEKTIQAKLVGIKLKE